MKLVEINWKPKDKELRQFGIICLAMLPLIGWLFTGRPWPSDWTTGQAVTYALLAGVAAVVALLGWVRPQSIRFLFVGLMIVTIPIGMVIGEIMFLLMYFVIFTPVALYFKLTGRDALHRKIEPAAQTYWQPKSQPADVRRYFRQY